MPLPETSSPKCHLQMHCGGGGCDMPAETALSERPYMGFPGFNSTWSRISDRADFSSSKAESIFKGLGISPSSFSSCGSAYLVAFDPLHFHLSLAPPCSLYLVVVVLSCVSSLQIFGMSSLSHMWCTQTFSRL